MRPKYFVRVNKNDIETISDKYDLETTRKAEYTKFAKQAIKDGAESVDIYASFTPHIDKGTGFGYVQTFYPEDFNVK